MSIIIVFLTYQLSSQFILLGIQEVSFYFLFYHIYRHFVKFKFSLSKWNNYFIFLLNNMSGIFLW